MDDCADLLRKLNLVEVLEEQARAAGFEPASLPEDAPETWSESQIRAHFSRTPSQPARTFQEPDPVEFNKWFPAYQKFKAPPGSRPKLRIVCLPCAGSAEDMYTSEGTGSRRVVSPLLEWCRANGAEVLAAQPPGRGMRMRESHCRSAQEVADCLLPLLGPKLQDGTPYVVISHSMGSWIAFELLLRTHQAGLPKPHAWFLSAMPFPSIPMNQRPWRKQDELDDDQFKGECCGWDINEAVFKSWSMFEPLLRADFHLFDSYHMTADCPVLFEGLTVHAFWGKDDKRISESMVHGWKQFTTGTFTCTAIDGNHLWPLQKDSKLAWLEAITSHLKSMFGAQAH